VYVHQKDAINNVLNYLMVGSSAVFNKTRGFPSLLLSKFGFSPYNT